MAGIRVLQIVIHFIMAILSLGLLSIVFLEHRAELEDLLMAIIALILCVSLAASIGLNWVLAKEQFRRFSLPATSLIQFLMILAGFVTIYFAAHLGSASDDHLSSFDLYAVIPEWAWGTDYGMPLQIGIAGRPAGIYMLLFYVFVFMLLAAMHTHGLFMHEAHPVYAVVSRWLLIGHLVTGLIFVAGMLYAVYECWRRIGSFAEMVAFDEGLLNGTNLGRIFFQCVNVAVWLCYAVWILVDALRLFKKLKLRFPVPDVRQ